MAWWIWGGAGAGLGETWAVCGTDASTILSESIGRRMASGKCFQSPGTSLPSVEFPNLSLGVHPVSFQAHHPRVLSPYPESSHSRGLAMLWRPRSSSRIYTDNMYWVCRHSGREFHWGTKQAKTLSAECLLLGHVRLWPQPAGRMLLKDAVRMVLSQAPCISDPLHTPSWRSCFSLPIKLLIKDDVLKTKAVFFRILFGGHLMCFFLFI